MEAGGGAFGAGCARGEFPVRPGAWFLDQPPEDDGFMPSALGLELLWQLLGFFLAWRGAPGLGRAIAVTDFRICGLIGPQARIVECGIDVRIFKRARVTLGVADGWIRVDGHLVSTARALKYGLFSGDRDPGRDAAIMAEADPLVE